MFYCMFYFTCDRSLTQPYYIITARELHSNLDRRLEPTGRVLKAYGYRHGFEGGYKHTHLKTGVPRGTFQVYIFKSVQILA